MNPNQIFRPLPRRFALVTAAALAMSLHQASAQTFTLCYKNQTIQVPSYQLNNYVANGATVGGCGGPQPSLVVLNTNNAGAGSLRQIILTAASMPNGAIVTFAPNVTNTITLTSGEIPITKNIYMIGPGAKTLSISGNNTSRVFNILGGTNTICGLTIRDGRAVGSSGIPEANGAQQRGGGIMNEAILTLSGCIIRNNVVVGGQGGNGLPSFAGNGGNASGGGVGNIGTLVLLDCSLINNSAIGGQGGNDSGGNNGMGGQGYGGGLYNFATATVTRCTVSGNHASAGAGPGQPGGGSGGGIYNESSLELFTCTVAENAADGSPNDFGGGIYDQGTVLTIRNSTVSGNQADFGGGLNTFAANVGNTILAGNIAGTDPDGSGSINSSDYNLILSANGLSITGATSHNIYGQNPLLGPLQDNGGPLLVNNGSMFTMALLPGSPAIDKGKSFGIVTDQRWNGRLADFPSIANATGGDASDIGAFEVMPNNPQLNIARATTNVVLFWSTDALGFRLQSLASFSATNFWLAVGGTPVTNGGQLFITNAATSGNKFYRLAFP